MAFFDEYSREELFVYAEELGMAVSNEAHRLLIKRIKGDEEYEEERAQRRLKFLRKEREAEAQRLQREKEMLQREKEMLQREKEMQHELEMARIEASWSCRNSSHSVTSEWPAIANSNHLKQMTKEGNQGHFRNERHFTSVKNSVGSPKEANTAEKPTKEIVVDTINEESNFWYSCKEEKRTIPSEDSCSSKGKKFFQTSIAKHELQVDNERGSSDNLTGVMLPRTEDVTKEIMVTQQLESGSKIASSEVVVQTDSIERDRMPLDTSTQIKSTKKDDNEVLKTSESQSEELVKSEQKGLTLPTHSSAGELKERTPTSATLLVEDFCPPERNQVEKLSLGVNEQRKREENRPPFEMFPQDTRSSESAINPLRLMDGEGDCEASRFHGTCVTLSSPESEKKGVVCSPLLERKKEPAAPLLITPTQPKTTQRNGRVTEEQEVLAVQDDVNRERSTNEVTTDIVVYEVADDEEEKDCGQVLGPLSEHGVNVVSNDKNEEAVWRSGVGSPTDYSDLEILKSDTEKDPVAPNSLKHQRRKQKNAIRKRLVLKQLFPKRKRSEIWLKYHPPDPGVRMFSQKRQRVWVMPNG